MSEGWMMGFSLCCWQCLGMSRCLVFRYRGCHAANSESWRNLLLQARAAQRCGGPWPTSLTPPGGSGSSSSRGSRGSRQQLKRLPQPSSAPRARLHPTAPVHLRPLAPRSLPPPQSSSSSTHWGGNPSTQQEQGLHRLPQHPGTLLAVLMVDSGSDVLPVLCSRRTAAPLNPSLMSAAPIYALASVSITPLAVVVAVTVVVVQPQQHWQAWLLRKVLWQAPLRC